MRRWIAVLRLLLGVAGMVAGLPPSAAQPRPATAAAPASAGEIVIGQSLPISGPLFESAQAVQSGAKVHFERINREGGIGGRPVRVVTLDDRGDPGVLRENLRKLARDEGAVAFMNCVGDAACRVAATQAEQLGIPLIGALSGSADLRRAGLRRVFNVRAGYDRESAALARQLTMQGAQRVVLVGDSADNEALRMLAQVLRNKQIESEHITLPDTTDPSLQALLQRVQSGQFGAAVVQLSQPSVNRLEFTKLGQRPEWPVLVMSFANPALTQTALAFGSRIFAFSNVVPNPDRAALPLVRAFQADMEQYGTAWGASFEGLESYLNAGVCAAGLRAVRGAVNPDSLTSAMRSLGSTQQGGFLLHFGEGRSSASDWVDLGVLTRERIFVR